jgi:hypothetical protein
MKRSPTIITAEPIGALSTPIASAENGASRELEWPLTVIWVEALADEKCESPV